MYSSRRTQETTQTFRAAAAKQGTFKSHDLYSDWVTRKWELGGASASDNCEPELQKKHVALPPGRSLRNPNNWRFPMEKVTALLTVYPWPIWETALAKITSLLISSAGGGSDSHQLKGDWGGKLELPVKKGERKAKITNMCNTTCDSFQEIPIQQFSGNRLCLCVAVCQGRRTAGCLENRLNTWMGNKPKTVTRNVPYPFHILAFAYSTFPCSWIPRLFSG